MHETSVQPPSMYRPTHRKPGRLVFVLAAIAFVSTILWWWSVAGDSFMSWDYVQAGPYLDLPDLIPRSVSWRAFKSTGPISVAPYIERTSNAETYMSPECADAWVAKGQLCEALTRPEHSWALGNELKLSILHTWTNGSDLILQHWREGLHRLPLRMPGARWAPGIAARHFRNHNELLYSMRSIIQSLPEEDIAGLHLITTDLPIGNETEIRAGQVPSWLGEQSNCKPQINLHHHWNLFKMRPSAASETLERNWRAEALPSFNSIGIESQIVTLASQLTDTILYFNDDFFLAQNLGRGDFASPLFGPIFRLQNDLLVSSTPKGKSKADPEGEWPSLMYANWLLDQRFGYRKRPYIAHIVKTFSAPVLEEIANVWGEEFTDSAAVRFRGQDNGTALNLAFLATHYTVERHREALLWSFFVARSDRDGSGTYSPIERRLLLVELRQGREVSNDDNDDYKLITIPLPTRKLHRAPEDDFRATGLPVPLATTFLFNSQEGGYAYSQLGTQRPMPQSPPNAKSYKSKVDSNARQTWFSRRPNRKGVVPPSKCTIDVIHCLGADFGSGLYQNWGSSNVNEVFRRVAFENPLCGDCVIASLLRSSGSSGFSAFLPDEQTDSVKIDQVGLSMSNTWQKATFNSSGGRSRAISLIRRYSYAIGTSPTEVVAFSTSAALFRRLNLIPAKNPAFLALNDDTIENLLSIELRKVNDVLARFLNNRWPNKMCWEI